ncbi:MAG: ATP-binding protein [Desulfovibrionaceae bacterium]|nr:ATP-binding protein [Desulfovibrionaceae bacterium]
MTRFLSWISLVLILASSIVLAFFLGNSARDTIMTRRQEYASLLAGYLNQQIYRRFTLPTVLAYGRITLRQTEQYHQLDEVIQSTVAGLKLQSLRIYGSDCMVNYSFDSTELGRTDLVPSSMELVMVSSKPAYETMSSVGMLASLFCLDVPAGTYSLRTLFPLTVSLGISETTGLSESLVTGVLEIRQDISGDYETIIRFQWLIFATCLSSSFFLFGLLQVFIRKAEDALTDRMNRTRKLEAELHQHEKLAGMGRVIASIAHEIRNPLGIIRSSAELLLRRKDQRENWEPREERILQAIYSETCRLGQTVNDFLDYARPRVPRREKVLLQELLQQALVFLDGELKQKEISVEHYVPENFAVSGDKDLLYRAIYNLLVNAYQAIGSSGVIRIRCRRLSDGMLELSFHDSGPGFPEALMTKIIEPFFTTKDHGTGLGLPIVSTIISGHGGRLDLSNNPDGGAVVTILLPEYGEEPQECLKKANV